MSVDNPLGIFNNRSLSLRELDGVFTLVKIGNDGDAVIPGLTLDDVKRLGDAVVRVVSNYTTPKTTLVREHDVVAILVRMPDDGLLIGDRGTVVHVYPDRKACEVEFPQPGSTKVITLGFSQIVPVMDTTRTVGPTRVESGKPSVQNIPKTRAGACCDNEKRSLAGGCENCGDPCL
jgi:hypothetical protein